MRIGVGILLAAVCAGAASASGVSHSRSIATSGVRIAVPAGWYAAVSKTPDCDPERLLVLSSAPVHLHPGRRLAAPARGNVLLLLLEDRYSQDRPAGDLRRPSRFSVAWDRLVRLEPCCGEPAGAPAFMRYFESHGRYLGFIVYPGAHVGAATRAKTLAAMDSLRVGA